MAFWFWFHMVGVLMVFIQTYWTLQIDGRGQSAVQKCDGIAEVVRKLEVGKDSKTKFVVLRQLITTNN